MRFSKSHLRHSLLIVLAATILVLGSAASAFAQAVQPPRFVLDRVSKSEQARWNVLTREISAAKGLRVFWWNIANGGGEGDVRTLSSNLELLVRSKLSPDVLALGEYSARALPESTSALLETQYPIRQHIRYNSLTSNGIAIFSRLPLKTVRAANLRWIPSALSAEEVVSYREFWAQGHTDGGDGFYVRPLREIEIVYEGKSIAFTPIHLAQPWRELGKRADGKVDFALLTMRELYFGTKNPLITQVNVLTNWLNAGTTPEKIVVGDFNLPRSFVGFPTLGFSRLDGILDPAIKQVENSFPTPSSPHSYPPMQIDHAFVGGNLKVVAAGVLPLKGSDHYPVFAVIR
ncbi:MAG: endonuclease/exonuclease/phosphatase family protein [Bdellovibrionota bacterium]